MQYKDYASRMISILKMDHPPLAVKLLKAVDPVPEGFDNTKRLRFCQSLMMAKHGHKILLTPENITCPAAASAFGFKPLPEKLAGGEVMYTMGLFGNREAGAKTLGLMPRLKQGECSAVLITPLEKADFEPDVIVLEEKTEKLMWIGLADIFNTGGRHAFQTSIFQTACIDSTVVPYLTGKLNASLGCYGCRDATDILDEESLIGFPAKRLEEIVSSLERLSEKAIPRVRAKGALKTLGGYHTEGSE
ncbi:MAG: hypothetical protein COY75_09285 [Nitrospirae bacterium CG_4_10_14_0_8_um_filter_41_23]|nr:DUF169 domain-containing protein [Nitrospirota bacterium]OIP60464.1 MAG: hypothetical protein AUK38_03480 [Nitrospirae bacterium CG2_30_41_42]PIQ95252.1 MAG: hypothetical protein COV68_00280 [Nitrospirae bacterium CG11_big_fil_rev_8_21_14_0_20_41_14]PIV43892.1 MAG: hypothetical protein COS27_03565 [Nitrospirae bacterium CG02_land_8_20_14_3_00_41_53]PIW86521.1 MAG: hypothetical protein COZ94_09945 [Nitrospirae bacterium CG_4_8_14_3_um_filter_41_47]PIY86189.1 MAG: hypothetical protein COY75_0